MGHLSEEDEAYDMRINPEAAVANSALGLRFGVKQAAAWRMLAEVVRRHPELQILEMHAGGGQYDEVVVWNHETHESPVRCNYVGSVHLGVDKPTWEQRTWIEALTLAPRELIRQAEELAELTPPRAVPKSTPRTLTYRAISHLAASVAFDREGLHLVNGVADSSGYSGTSIREESFVQFPRIKGHRRMPDATSPFGRGEYRFWFAYTGDGMKGNGDPVLAFETIGHAWKPGPGDDDRFDFVRTYEAVDRSFPRLMAAFDEWRAVSP